MDSHKYANLDNLSISSWTRQMNNMCGPSVSQRKTPRVRKPIMFRQASLYKSNQSSIMTKAAPYPFPESSIQCKPFTGSVSNDISQQVKKETTS